MNSSEKRQRNYSAQAFCLFALPVVVMELLNGYENFPSAVVNVLGFVFERYLIFLLTVLFFYSLYVVLSIVFLKRRQIAYVISFSIMMGIAFVHFYKQQVLGSVVSVNDLNIFSSDLIVGVFSKLNPLFIIGYLTVVVLIAFWGWNTFKHMHSLKENRLERSILASFLVLLLLSYTAVPPIRYALNGTIGIRRVDNPKKNYRNAGIIFGLLNGGN